MRVRTISGVKSNGVVGHTKKSVNISSNLAINPITTDIEQKRKVVPIRQGMGSSTTYDDWLTKIEEGRSFACRRRASYPLGEVFLDVFTRLEGTRVINLVELTADLAMRWVNPVAFSQMYEFMEFVNVEDSGSQSSVKAES